jgi:uncharacterized protein (TIGR00299 family) protein
MAHDDPKHPHSHHAPDDLIAAPPARGAARRTHRHADGTVHAHDHAHEGDAGPQDKPRAPDAAAAQHARALPRRRLERGAGRGLVLHFDCFAGLSGDMTVGALADLGVPLEALAAALEALPLEGFRIAATDKVVHAIAATKFVVEVSDEQPYRTYRDVRALLDAAPLEPAVRARAQRAFRALAEAEGRIHRIAPDDVHFHEVGAVDAIVDIVAASVAMEWVGAEVCCAPLPMGHGFVRAEHGTIPLPAPAVVELLAGIPTEGANVTSELVTPTGAALIRANATRFERWPAMRPVATGFGAGTRTLPDRPNLLRVVLGEPVTASPGARGGGGGGETFVVLEANLDDATGEIVAHATEALLRAGALDAWTVPIGMKKARPGLMLCALGRAADGDGLARVMMAESTTLGVRRRTCERAERPRRMVQVETEYGAVAVKVADGDGLPTNAKPEDDEVLALALRAGVPARAVQTAALAAFWSGASRHGA